MAAVTTTVTIVIPPGHVGFVGSPGEFARAERFGPVGSFATALALPVGDGRREFRLFALPPGTVLGDMKRIPGFNILVLSAGATLTLRVIPAETTDDAGAHPRPAES